MSPYFLQFLFYVCIAFKKLTQVFSYVVCTPVRRHVHKRITKRRYEEKKPVRFVFGKLVLCTIGLGLTTHWVFWFEIFTWRSSMCLLRFWLRFEPQIRPTRLARSFLLITARAERQVLSCVKLFFFSLVNTDPLDLKFVAFCPEFNEDYYVEFQEKTISGGFFRIFRSNQGYPLSKLVKFRPTFCNFYSASVLCWKNSHMYFHMLFAPR